MPPSEAAERPWTANRYASRDRKARRRPHRDWFPYDLKRRQGVAQHLTQFLVSARGVRRDGSAAIDMAYVACGRFDGFWEDGLNPWDMAAGVLLIEESGGQVTGYDSSKFSIYRPPVLASNGLIHAQMSAVLTS